MEDVLQWPHTEGEIESELDNMAEKAFIWLRTYSVITCCGIMCEGDLGRSILEHFWRSNWICDLGIDDHCQGQQKDEWKHSEEKRGDRTGLLLTKQQDWRASQQ